MTAFERSTPAVRTWTLAQLWRAWWSPATQRRARPSAGARTRRHLPMYEALAIGLGCDIASINRRTRDTRAGTSGAGGAR